MTGKNSMQAILDRQQATAANPEPQPAPAASPPTVSPLAAPPPAEPVAKASKHARPSRDGRKFIGGHFTPGAAKQLRLLAAEEGATTQLLLEEALELLFIKKGKGKLHRV